MLFCFSPFFGFPSFFSTSDEVRKYSCYSVRTPSLCIWFVIWVCTHWTQLLNSPTPSFYLGQWFLLFQLLCFKIHPTAAPFLSKKLPPNCVGFHSVHHCYWHFRFSNTAHRQFACRSRFHSLLMLENVTKTESPTHSEDFLHPQGVVRGDVWIIFLDKTTGGGGAIQFSALREKVRMKGERFIWFWGWTLVLLLEISLSQWSAQPNCAEL